MGLAEQFTNTSQMGQLSMLRSMMQGDTSQAVLGLVRTCPDFANFLRDMTGREPEEALSMSPEEAYKSKGYDLATIVQMIGNA